MGKPEDLSFIDNYMVDNINIYLPKSLETRNKEIRIKHSKFLWKEFLEVEGLKINQI